MNLFVDNLTNIDFSYLHPERGLLGETWLAHTRLDGSLDEQGMVCDFGIVKKVLRDWLDNEIDHRLLIPIHSPNLELQEDGEQITVHWRYALNNGHSLTFSCTSPRQAFALVEAETITEHSVAEWSIHQLQPHFPDTLNKLQLRFSPEHINTPFYHYSHGLKKHAGNCQRIAHGHRSRIEIWQNGKRAPKLEQQWAERWRDIYIGSTDDSRGQQQGNHLFAYSTPQGDFTISVPEQQCYQINTDSTVEFIALHIAQKLKHDQPQQHFRVRAFEGLNKGAEVEL